MSLSTFGTPFTYPAQFSPWGISPHGTPLIGAPLSSTIASPAFGPQSLQQVLPLLQIVPQQLQHLQQLVSIQLQELQRLQQIVQLVPAQLQQLQQLIHLVPQQFQQSFGQGGGVGSFATPPWGIGSHAFGAQPNQVFFGAQPNQVM